MEGQFPHGEECIRDLIRDSASNKTEHQSFRRRLDILEENGRRQNEILVTLQRQADAIEAMNEKIDLLAGGVNRVAGRVAEIERGPGEKWRKISFEIIKYIVLAAVGAAVGFVMK